MISDYAMTSILFEIQMNLARHQIRTRQLKTSQKINDECKCNKTSCRQAEKHAKDKPENKPKRHAKRPAKDTTRQIKKLLNEVTGRTYGTKAKVPGNPKNLGSGKPFLGKLARA